MKRWCCLCLTLLSALLGSACGDDPVAPGEVDVLVIFAPRQVFVGQSFIIDASATSSQADSIQGYVFSFDDGNPRTIVRDPELVYRYDTPGTYQVELSLLGREGVATLAVEAVSCDQQVLQCGPLPQRPCPPGYQCGSASTCELATIICTTNDQCPESLACQQGVCGAPSICEP